MQCGCPQCGELMAQVHKGLRSHCECPRCGTACSLCMGRPIGEMLPRESIADLAFTIAARVQNDSLASEEEEDKRESIPPDKPDRKRVEDL